MDHDSRFAQLSLNLRLNELSDRSTREAETFDTWLKKCDFDPLSDSDKAVLDKFDPLNDSEKHVLNRYMFDLFKNCEDDKVAYEFKQHISFLKDINVGINDALAWNDDKISGKMLGLHQEIEKEIQYLKDSKLNERMRNCCIEMAKSIDGWCKMFMD